MPLTGFGHAGPRSSLLRAERFVVAKIELTEVALQVLLADVMVRAGDAALQDRKVILNRVRMPEAAANVFLDAEG